MYPDHATSHRTVHEVDVDREAAAVGAETDRKDNEDLDSSNPEARVHVRFIPVPNERESIAKIPHQNTDGSTGAKRLRRSVS